MPGQVGNKGGGRQSAYAEKVNAKELVKALFNQTDRYALEEKISSGVYSIWDKATLLGLEGDTKIIKSMVDKAFPSSIVAEDEEGRIVPIIVKKAD